MYLTDVTHISLIGKFSSNQGDVWSTPINIKELLLGETSFIETVFPEELYLKSFEFEIFAHEEGGENREKVGKLFGRFFDLEKCEEDEFDPLEVFDAVDQYTYDVYTLGEKYHKGIYSNNIFLIDSMIINPEYRNKKIGSSAICILADVIGIQYNLKVGCIILKPEPIYVAPG